MADDDADITEVDPDDYTPVDQGQPVEGHGYDAVFFIVAILVAVGFIAALYFFHG
jgi:hypothetical protein